MLDSPGTGVYIPADMGAEYRHSPDAVLSVFASHAYDDADYIRDYDELDRLIGAERGVDLPQAVSVTTERFQHVAGADQPWFGMPRASGCRRRSVERVLGSARASLRRASATASPGL